MVNFIDKVELFIGGQLIDTQDSIFTEKIAIDTMAKNVSNSALGVHPGTSGESYFYPLRFFFCESPQYALPIVALQYHNVELRIHWGPGVVPIILSFIQTIITLIMKNEVI